MITIEDDDSAAFSFTLQPQRRFDVLSPSLEYRASLEKWGLLPDTVLMCFTFDQLYHRGKRDAFVRSFFQSDEVRQHFRLANGRGDTSVVIPHLSKCVARVEELSCSETSLAMFDRLVNNEIVRESLDGADDDGDGADTDGNGGSGGGEVAQRGSAATGDDEDGSQRSVGEGNNVAVRSSSGGPSRVERICQMMDVYLPCGVTVSDHLRGLFLLGEESEHVGVFSEEEQHEFLYHVMWRLLAGGALNQWDDNFVVYKDVARALYKDLVCVGRDDETGELKLLSHVLSVTSVDGVPLFPKDDQRWPSNGNYLYLVVNASRKEVVVWYHGFWSTF